MGRSILQIVGDGRPGGGTTAVLGLCEDLVAQGEEVTLATDRNSYASNRGIEIGAKVVELPFFTSRLDPRIALQLHNLISTLRPQIVHAHGARAGLPLSFCPRSAERRVYTVHGYHFVGKGKAGAAFARLAEARIARNSDYGVFVSEADAKIAEDSKFAFARSSVIYNGILLDDIVPQVAEPPYDLVFCARLHRQKNPEFLIDIMRAMRGSGVKLLLAGGGELEARVKQAALEAGLDGVVTLSGQLARADALAAIASAKLFIMPSLWEGLPIAPIESMAAGTPVVASDIPGIREVVTPGVTGLLVPGFDAQHWASSIRDLLGDVSRRQEFAAAGKADVATRFLRQRSSAAHIAVYDFLAT
jgi:glycosyltransferase involved in cell wall biosynthesis